MNTPQEAPKRSLVREYMPATVVTAVVLAAGAISYYAVPAPEKSDRSDSQIAPLAPIEPYQRPALYLGDVLLKTRHAIAEECSGLFGSPFLTDRDKEEHYEMGFEGFPEARYVAGRDVQIEKFKRRCARRVFSAMARKYKPRGVTLRMHDGIPSEEIIGSVDLRFTQMTAVTKRSPRPAGFRGFARLDNNEIPGLRWNTRKY